MMLCKPRCFLTLREVGIAETACPYRAVLVFVEYDCYWQVVVVEQFYLFSFDAKLQQTPRSQRNPKVAIAVNKNHVVSVAEGVGCLNFVDIAKKIGGISGQDAAKAWLMVKDAREAYANREQVVYRKHHINKK